MTLSTSSLPRPPRSIQSQEASDRRQQLENDLARVRRAWTEYERSNDKHRAYRFLRVAYAVVCAWRESKRSQALARRVLNLIDAPPYMAIEPFSIVILAGAGPDLDHRCRSTWSRALRLAARHDVPPTKLSAFIRHNGGLNKCAAALSRQRKRAAPHLDERHAVRG
jgi:hypothetical protein